MPSAFAARLQVNEISKGSCLQGLRSVVFRPSRNPIAKCQATIAPDTGAPELSVARKRIGVGKTSPASARCGEEPGKAVRVAEARPAAQQRKTRKKIRTIARPRR